MLYQYIITGLIVVIAVLYLGIKIKNALKGGGCSCGCSCGDKDSSSLPRKNNTGSCCDCSHK